MKAVRLILYFMTLLILTAFIAPFHKSNGPISWYYEWQGRPFVQFPFAGEWAYWLRWVICVLALVGLVFVWFRGEQGTRTRGFLLVSAGAISLLYVLSASPKEVPLAIMTWLPFWGILLFSRKEKESILWLLCALLMLQMVVGLGAFFLDYDQFKTAGIGSRASGLFRTPNGMYPLCLFGFFMFFAMTEHFKERKVQMFFMVFIILSLMLLFLTYSRAGWLGLSVGIFATFLWHRKYRWLLAVVSVLFILATLTVRTGASVAELKSDKSLAGRIVSIQEGVKVLKEKPWVGSGPHAFAQSEGFRVLKERSVFAPYEPKNLLVHVAIEYGLLGLMLYLLYWLAGLRLSLRRVHESLDSKYSFIAAKCFIPGSIAIACASMFDTPIFANLLRFPTTLVFCVLLALSFETR